MCLPFRRFQCGSLAPASSMGLAGEKPSQVPGTQEPLGNGHALLPEGPAWPWCRGAAVRWNRQVLRRPPSHPVRQQAPPARASHRIVNWAMFSSSRGRGDERWWCPQAGGTQDTVSTAAASPGYLTRPGSSYHHILGTSGVWEPGGQTLGRAAGRGLSWEAPGWGQEHAQLQCAFPHGFSFPLEPCEDLLPTRPGLHPETISAPPGDGPHGPWCSPSLPDEGTGR